MAQPDRETLEAVQLTGPTMGSSSNGERTLTSERGHFRGQGQIENNLHWVLDVTFREDESRVRDRISARNLAVLRKIALTLISRDQASRTSKWGRGKQAAWNDNYTLNCSEHSTPPILMCVRWYCKYDISYRDLAEMMQERGVAVAHTTIFRWVQRYASEIEKRVRWFQGYRSPSWRVDETYVRVGGAWKYLFRAVDKTGRLIDFTLSDRRNMRAAYRFLGKALKTMRNWPPVSITTDKLGSYRKPFQRLQRDGRLSDDVSSRAGRIIPALIDQNP